MEQHRWRLSRTILRQVLASLRSKEEWTQLAERKAVKEEVGVQAAVGGAARAGSAAAAIDTVAGAGAEGEDDAVGMLPFIFSSFIYGAYS